MNVWDDDESEEEEKEKINEKKSQKSESDEEEGSSSAITRILTQKEKIIDLMTEANFIESPNRYILGVGPVNAHEANEYITEEKN